MPLDFVEDVAPAAGTKFDFQPLPEFDFQPDEEQSTPSARAYVPTPGEMVPTVARQTSLMPQMAPVAEMQAEQAKSIPPLAEGEAEAMLMTPQMHIPRQSAEGSALRGAEDLVYGIPEFATAPGAPLIATAQLIPVVREVVDGVLGASMVKAGAQELGEAWVTGNKEKLVRGTGSLLLGTAGVSVPWLRETVANELAARKVGKVDPALIDSIVKERLSIRNKAAQVVEPGTHEKLMPRATETFEATTGTKASQRETPNLIQARLDELEGKLGPRNEIDPSSPANQPRLKPARILTVEEQSLLNQLEKSSPTEIKTTKEHALSGTGQAPSEEVLSPQDSLAMRGGEPVKSSEVTSVRRTRNENGEVVYAIFYDRGGKSYVGYSANEAWANHSKYGGDAYGFTKEVTNASKVGEGETVLRDVLRDAQEGKGTEALPINEGQPGVRTESEVGSGWYNASHSELTQLDARAPKSVDSLGTWVTSNPENAKTLYGPKVFEVNVPKKLNLLEFDGSDPTQIDFNRVIGANAQLARESGFAKEASILERTLPDTQSLNALEKKVRNDERLTLNEDRELRSLREAEKASTKLLNSPAYMAKFRAMLENEGYDGIIWKKSRIDTRPTDPAHDVAVIFHKEPLKVTKREARTDVSGVGSVGKAVETKPPLPAAGATPESPATAAEAVSKPSTSGVAASEVPPVIREATTESASAQLSPSEQAKLFTPEALATPKEKVVGISPGTIGVDPVAANRLKNFVKEYFTTAGHIPKEIWYGPKAVLEGTLAESASVIKHRAREFEDALAEVYKYGRLARAGGATRQIPPQAVQIMADYLQGKVANPNVIPAPIRGVLDTMAAERTAYSEKIIDRLRVKQNRLKAGSAEWNSIDNLIQKIEANKDIYIHRAYKFFDNKFTGEEWYQKLPPKVRDDALKLVINNSTVPLTAAEAKKTIIRMLNDLKGDGGFGGGTKLGAKDLSIFMRRNVIAPEIRAVLGEYRSPLMNYAQSVSKMAEWLAKEKFLEDSVRLGKGRWLFEEGAASPEGFNKRIAPEGSDVMHPMNGLYTSEPIAKAWNEFYKGDQYPKWFRTYMAVNSATKIGATVYSMQGQARNLGSRPLMALAAGHIPFTKEGVVAAKTALKAIANELTGAFPKMNPYVESAKRHRMMDTSSNIGEMTADLGRAIVLQDVAPADIHSFSFLRAIKKYGFDIPVAFYKASDNLGNLFGWEMEKMNVKKVHPHWTPEEVNAEAAKIVRDIYPTYDETWKAVKAVRHFPGAGTFVVFPYQIVRNAANITVRSLTEIKSANPAEQAIGYKRLGGFIAAMTAGYAVQEISKHRNNIDSKKEEDFRRMQAPWAQKAQYAFINTNPENAQITSVNISYTNPFSYLTDPFVAMTSAVRQGEPVYKVGLDMLKEFFSPFMGEQMLFAAIRQALNGETDRGGIIWNKTDSDAVKWAKSADYLWMTVGPAFVRDLRKKIIPAYKNEQPTYGKKLELPIEIGAQISGFRVEKFDFKTGLDFKAKDFVTNDRDSESVFHQVVRQTKTTTPDDLMNAYKESDRRRLDVWKEMRKDFLAAVRNGVTESEAKNIMQRRGMTREDANAIARGVYKPMQLSEGAKKKAREMNREIPRQAIRDYQQTARNISLDD